MSDGSERCPKAPADETFLVNHLLRLEKSTADREVWKCARGCGHTEIRPNPFAKRTVPTP